MHYEYDEASGGVRVIHGPNENVGESIDVDEVLRLLASAPARGIQDSAAAAAVSDGVDQAPGNQFGESGPGPADATTARSTVPAKKVRKKKGKEEFTAPSKCMKTVKKLLKKYKHKKSKKLQQIDEASSKLPLMKWQKQFDFSDSGFHPKYVSVGMSDSKYHYCVPIMKWSKQFKIGHSAFAVKKLVVGLSYTENDKSSQTWMSPLGWHKKIKMSANDIDSKFLVIGLSERKTVDCLSTLKWKKKLKLNRNALNANSVIISVYHGK